MEGINKWDKQDKYEYTNSTNDRYNIRIINGAWWCNSIDIHNAWDYLIWKVKTTLKKTKEEGSTCVYVTTNIGQLIIIPS